MGGSNAHYSADSRVQTWAMLVRDRGSHHRNTTPAQYQNTHSCCYLSSFIFKLPVTCLIQSLIFWYLNDQKSLATTCNLQHNNIYFIILLSSNHHVLDVGSGLGGPARYLAHKTGCLVTAIELQDDLHREAENLTQRCNLQQKLKHITGDFLQMDLGGYSYQARVFLLIS